MMIRKIRENMKVEKSDKNESLRIRTLGYTVDALLDVFTTKQSFSTNKYIMVVLKTLRMFFCIANVQFMIQY